MNRTGKFKPGDTVVLKWWPDLFDDYGDWKRYRKKNIIVIGGITYYEDDYDKIWPYHRVISSVDDYGVIRFEKFEEDERDEDLNFLNNFICTEEVLMFPWERN